MLLPFPRSLNAAAVFGCAAVAFGVLPAAGAAQPKKNPQDSAPILMSRTGGGSMWANVDELRAAAEKGNPKAEAQFGEVLLRGEDGVPQDRPRAMAMLEKAARAGEASAAFRLGMLLDDGDGLPRDRARALAYFRAAAAGGAVEAFHNIGAAYASARGVRRDYAEALAWLILAKKRGSESPAESAVRSQIQKLRRPELLAAAEKRAGEIERELAQQHAADLLPPPPTASAPASAATVPPPVVPAPTPKLSPPPLALPKAEPPKVPAPSVP